MDVYSLVYYLVFLLIFTWHTVTISYCSVVLRKYKKLQGSPPNMINMENPTYQFVRNYTFRKGLAFFKGNWIYKAWFIYLWEMSALVFVLAFSIMYAFNYSKNVTNLSFDSKKQIIKSTIKLALPPLFYFIFFVLFLVYLDKAGRAGFMTAYKRMLPLSLTIDKINQRMNEEFIQPMHQELLEWVPLLADTSNENGTIYDMKAHSPQDFKEVALQIIKSHNIGNESNIQRKTRFFVLYSFLWYLFNLPNQYQIPAFQQLWKAINIKEGRTPNLEVTQLLMRELVTLPILKPSRVLGPNTPEIAQLDTSVIDQLNKLNSMIREISYFEADQALKNVLKSLLRGRIASFVFFILSVIIIRILSYIP